MKTLTVAAVLGVVGLGLALMAAAERSGNLPCCAETGSGSVSAATAPLVCTLTSKDLRQRRDDVHALLTEAATGVAEIENGFVVTFEKGHGAAIAEFIELERGCCAFFEFTLAFAANDGPITLTVTGPEGSKAFSRILFESIPKS